jgi:hypothetical protein
VREKRNREGARAGKRDTKGVEESKDKEGNVGV